MDQSQKVGIGILGGSGFGTGELLRLLGHHPFCEVVSVTSTSAPWDPIVKAHPHLQGFYNTVFSDALDFEALAEFENTIIFSALPHSVSCVEIEKMRVEADEKLNKFRIIDLSGDYRLSEPENHARYYPDSVTDSELREDFVYSIPEIIGKRPLRRGKYIANPGCLSTAAILSVAPLFCGENRPFLIEDFIAFDLKTGMSGAGRVPSDVTHISGRHGNLEAYKIFEHRHEAEVRQMIDTSEDTDLTISFVPHYLPINRGIYCTTYFTIPKGVNAQSLRLVYEEFYRDRPFIRLRENAPQIREVVGTNFCDIAFRCSGSRVCVMSAIDNFGKGMAGQAIQSMNIMLGLREDTGLYHPPLGLV